MPQAKKAFFEERGLDIEGFKIELKESTHQAIHGGGNWRLGRLWNGEWNNQIVNRILAAERLFQRGATPDEVKEIVLEMMREYRIEGDFVP